MEPWSKTVDLREFGCEGFFFSTIEKPLLGTADLDWWVFAQSDGVFPLHFNQPQGRPLVTALLLAYMKHILAKQEQLLLAQDHGLGSAVS
jgi:hypothetical protein